MNKKVDSKRKASNKKVFIGLAVVVIALILGGLFFAKESLFDGAPISDVDQENLAVQSSSGMGAIGEVSNITDNATSFPSDDVDMINRKEVLKGNSGIEDADETFIDDVKKSSGMGEIGNASNADDKSSSSPTDDVDMLEREERLKGNDGISDIEDSNLKVQSPASSSNLSSETSNVNEPVSVASEDIDFIKNKKNYHSFIVTFDFESIEVKSSEMDILNKVLKAKQNNPNTEIIVCGYTCDYGPNDVNNWISQYRAISVKNELKKLGVPEDNIKLYWYGKTKNDPQSAPNKGNRKCEILIHD